MKGAPIYDRNIGVLYGCALERVIIVDQFLHKKFERNSGQCAALYPAPGSPRFVAGAPLASDVIKCQLKPVAMAEYATTF